MLAMNKKPQRNDPCPCGSGKKYKQCCLKNEQQNIKTYTSDGKRKFKAKVLTTSSTASSIFGQSNLKPQQAQDPQKIEKMRLGKTQEDYQVETAQEEVQKEEKKVVPKIKKVAPHNPGEEFNPTKEDFTK
jgi:uncharacterized protein